MPVPAERNVEIISKPARQRDVPAPPEIGKSNRAVGKSKIVRHCKAKAQGNPDGSCRIAGEIAKNLACESQCRNPAIEHSWHFSVLVVDCLDDRREKTISKNDLLEQAESYKSKPEENLVGSCLTRFLELWDEFGRSHDRTRNEVRKEGHEQGIVKKAARRCRAPKIDVKGVGQGRKSIETDAHRKDDVPTGRVIDDTQRSCDRHKILDEKAAIFKIAQHSEVHENAGQHP